MTKLHTSHKKKGQLELLPLILLVLIPTTIIFAENITNFTQPDLTQMFENVSSELVSTPETNITNETVQASINNVTNETIGTPVNETVSNETIQNVTQPLNTTNETIVPTINETNQTIPEPPTSNETQIVTPAFTEPIIEISSPTKITRTETLNLTTTVINPNSVSIKNVLVTWNLPIGFEIISGSQTEFCGILEANASCSTTITVNPSLSSNLGVNEIKVSVSYER